MNSKSTDERVNRYRQMKACRNIFLKSFYDLDDVGDNVCTKDHLAVLLAEITIVKGFLREVLKEVKKTNEQK